MQVAKVLHFLGITVWFMALSLWFQIIFLFSLLLCFLLEGESKMKFILVWPFKCLNAKVNPPGETRRIHLVTEKSPRILIESASYSAWNRS